MTTGWEAILPPPEVVPDLPGLPPLPPRVETPEGLSDEEAARKQAEAEAALASLEIPERAPITPAEAAQEADTLASIPRMDLSAVLLPEGVMPIFQPGPTVVALPTPQITTEAIIHNPSDIANAPPRNEAVVRETAEAAAGIAETEASYVSAPVRTDASAPIMAVPPELAEAIAKGDWKAIAKVAAAKIAASGPEVEAAKRDAFLAERQRAMAAAQQGLVGDPDPGDVRQLWLCVTTDGVRTPHPPFHSDEHLIHQMVRCPACQREGKEGISVRKPLPGEFT